MNLKRTAVALLCAVILIVSGAVPKAFANWYDDIQSGSWVEIKGQNFVADTFMGVKAYYNETGNSVYHCGEVVERFYREAYGLDVDAGTSGIKMLTEGYKFVTPSTPKPGDVVYFQRGDIWRGTVLFCREGVTYSAYGEGEKPIITSSPENGAGAEKWQLVYEDENGVKIELRVAGSIYIAGENNDLAISKGDYFEGRTFESIIAIVGFYDVLQGSETMYDADGIQLVVSGHKLTDNDLILK